MRRPTSVAIGASLLLTLGGAATAQSPDQRQTARASAPDLSGTWVLDKDKSDFGLLPAPGADTSTYTREDTIYRVVETGEATPVRPGSRTRGPSARARSPRTFLMRKRPS